MLIQYITQYITLTLRPNVLEQRYIRLVIEFPKYIPFVLHLLRVNIKYVLSSEFDNTASILMNNSVAIPTHRIDYQCLRPKINYVSALHLLYLLTKYQDLILTPSLTITHRLLLCTE